MFDHLVLAKTSSGERFSLSLDIFTLLKSHITYMYLAKRLIEGLNKYPSNILHNKVISFIKLGSVDKMNECRKHLEYQFGRETTGNCKNESESLTV